MDHLHLFGTSNSMRIEKQNNRKNARHTERSYMTDKGYYRSLSCSMGADVASTHINEGPERPCALTATSWTAIIIRDTKTNQKRMARGSTAEPVLTPSAGQNKLKMKPQPCKYVHMRTLWLQSSTVHVDMNHGCKAQCMWT